MKPMTPEDAQIVLVGAKEHGSHLSIGYRRALETIAGMREEWGVAVTYPGLAEVVEWGFCTRDGAEAEGATLGVGYRIVRRYVTEPEET